MISLDKVHKEELYFIDDLFSSAITSILCIGTTFATGIISVSPLGMFVSLNKKCYVSNCVSNFFACLKLCCSILLFLLFSSISYLVNCFWYLTHSSSNVIWLKSKCSILLVIISVLGVLGSVPDCSETILCMMSFNFAGRKVLRNWKVTIDFAIRYYSKQLTNVQIQKRKMKRHFLTKFLNPELTLGFKKTYMSGFQKQFL